MKLIIYLPTTIDQLREVDLRAATAFQSQLRNRNITDFCFVEPSGNKKVTPRIMFEGDKCQQIPIMAE